MKNKQILIVEDDSIIAAYLQETLSWFGYKILDVVSTGEQAIKLASETKPDIIIMDIQLKGDINGVTASKLIRKKSNVPIIYLSAYSEDTLLEQAMETKPSAFLLKPFNERELHANIIMAIYRAENP